MNTLHRHLLAAGLLAGIGFGAWAQTPAPEAAPGTPHMMQGEHRHMEGNRAEHFRARMQERMAKKLAVFKEQLRITPAQESAWAAWTASLQPGARPQRPDPAEIARMTTPERIDRLRALRAQRNAEMDRKAEATKAFYAQLSPAQRTVFDAETLKFALGMHRHGGWEHHREHGERGEHGRG
jgi:hypothetical protein